MTKKHKMLVVFLVFLLIVVAFGIFVKSQQQPEKLSDNPPVNQWLFPDCPGITAKFLDLHPDFKTNRNLLRGWVKEQSLTYHEIKAWLEILKSDESDFARWIRLVKVMQFPSSDNRRWYYAEPRWLKDNVNIDELRNEYKIWKEN